MRIRDGALVIKKYGNRRLYDTNGSRYITLEELADIIRAGSDVRVVDAKTGEDLTAGTLSQIIIEGRGAGKMLPVPLLTQLIRLDDAALGEFMGRFLGWSLDLYIQARQGAQMIAPINPFANMPFLATNALARLFSSGSAPWSQAAPPPQATNGAPAPAPEPPAPSEDYTSLRRELEELKAALGSLRRKK